MKDETSSLILSEKNNRNTIIVATEINSGEQIIINEKNEVLAYLVKFRNTTGILSANQQSIPVILLQDFKDYFGC